MATLLATTTARPLLCPGTHFQSNEYIKTPRCVEMTYRSQAPPLLRIQTPPTRCVKMMYSSQAAPVLRIQTPVLKFSSFIGFRASNSLDLEARHDQDFVRQVNLSISSSSRKAKASRCVTKAMFERFTVEAIEVITLSDEEARILGHDFVGTEQILLGLIMEETGIAAKVLTSMGITFEDTREEVEKIIGRGSGSFPKELPFTPCAKRVLRFSVQEAVKLGHNYIGTEHLLLALLRKEADGVAARVLENLGADRGNIRTQVLSMLQENGEVR